MPQTPVKQPVIDDGLVDIATVHIDTGLPVEERIRQFAEQVKTPYRFRAGRVIVNIEHKNDGLKLDDAIAAYLSCL